MKTKKPRFFYGYVVVLAAFFILMIAGGVMYTFGVFFKPLLAEFGWTRAATSGAYSLYFALHGLFYIATGRLNDRFGPRVVVSVCGFFLGLGYLLMSQISAIWQLYLFYGVIMAIGMSGGFVPLTSTIARWFIKRRAMMTGIVVAGVGVGTMIMPPVASWLISVFGWRTSYIIIGLIALVFIISAAQFLRHAPSQVGQQPYGSDEVREDSLDLEAGDFSLQRAIQTRQFWLLLGVLFCHNFVVQAIMVHIAPHITDLGISAMIAAGMLTIIGGLSIAGRIIMGGVADGIGNKPTYVIGFILMLVALLGLLVAKEVWTLYLFAAILGFGYGGQSPLISPMVAELFQLRSHGAILGIITFGSTIGGAISPILAGHIFDVSDSYQPVFLTCTTICIIGLIQILLLRPIGRRGEIKG